MRNNYVSCPQNEPFCKFYAICPAAIDPRRVKSTSRTCARYYNAVRVGDRGVVVGPCNVLTMPNAGKRVLVDFGSKGLYNYAVDTQLYCEEEAA